MKLLKSYLDFRGGLNVDAAPDNLADNELMQADNANLDERGAASSRRGTQPLLALSGTLPAQTGMTSTQVKLSAAASAVDDYYNTFQIVIGGQARAISDYDGTNKICAVAAWTTQPVGGGTFEVAVNYGAQVERIIEWPRKDGTKTLLAVIGTTLCKLDSTTFKKTDLQALASADIGYFSYADNFYFCDGTNYWYYDGTNVVLVELATPGAAPTLGHSGSGTALGAGTFKGKVVFLNSLGVESQPSAEASVTITSGQQIDWSAIATGAAGTTKRRLYRTAVGGSVFKLLYEIPDNTATTYTDTTADASLGAALVIDGDLAPIKRCSCFLWHPKSQRIFAIRDSSDMAALYYSEPGEPAYFKEVSKLYPTTGDGPAYGLALFGESIVVIYQNSNWAWKGVDPATDAEWIKLPSEQGTVTNRTIRLTPNSLTFLGQGGIISLSPGLIDYSIVMLTSDELIKNRTKDKVTSIIRAITNQEIACGIYDRINERYLMAYTDVASATRNSKILALDWGLQRFTRYTGLQANDFCQRSNGDILIASNGYILKMGQGYKDWDVDTGNYKAISWLVKSKHYNLDYPFHIKKLKKFFLAAKQFDIEASSVDIKLLMDYQYLDLSSVSLDESFSWGEVWGNPWGWSDLSTKEARVKAKGSRVQVEMSNDTIDEPVVIYGFAFEYKPKKAKGVKVN